MKVFLVAGGHPQWNKTGEGIFAWDQALALKKSGLNIIYLVLDCRSIRRKRKLGFRFETVENIPILGLSVPLGRIHFYIFSVIARFFFGILFKKAVKLFGRPDIIHTHFIGMGVSALKVSIRESIPLIHTEHSSLIIQGNIGKCKLFIYAKVYRHATKVIAVSRALSKKIKLQFGVEAEVIPNVVDLAIFSLDNSTVKRDGELRIVSAGNLIPSKQHDLTISTFSDLLCDFPSIHLTICGSGSDYGKLSNMINELNLRSHVTLIGHIPREKLARLFHNSSFFVLPSRFETFGLVYAEAMAAGLPVIATKCGGPEDIIIDCEEGLLIEVDDRDALEAAMRYMILNVDNFDRSTISKNALHRFSPERIAIELINIYSDVLNLGYSYD